MKIFFVRHGQSMWNSSPTIQGSSPHVPLSPKGKLQAMALSDWFCDQGLIFDSVYSSSARRAIETAHLALGHVEKRSYVVVASDSLHEVRQGIWEGKHISLVPDFGKMKASEEEFLNLIPEEGESVEQGAERILAWFNATSFSDHNVVFCHGLIIRCLLWKLNLISTQQLLHASLRNTSLTVISCENGKWACEVYNWTPHFR